MQTSVIGYPRIGKLRELKFAEEKYFKGELSERELRDAAEALRVEHWRAQDGAEIDFIPSNDFSFYDTTLDAAALLNIVPARYRALGLSALDTYFAMARGYQGPAGDVKALAMKKWFNTNYHYTVPEIDDDTQIKLVGTKPFDEFAEARSYGFDTKPVLLGPITLLKLARFTGTRTIADVEADVTDAYIEAIEHFGKLGAFWVQIDVPWLVRDLTAEDLALVRRVYERVLANTGAVKVLLQTYFGDVRDCYELLCELPFDGIGLDFVEGTRTLELVREHGFPARKYLFAGLVNGKNIWRNHYGKTVDVVEKLRATRAEVVLSTSCSLLHVPYTLANETKLNATYTEHFAFAVEKLGELRELADLLEERDPRATAPYQRNVQLIAGRPDKDDPAVQARVAAISDSEYTRLPARAERERLQKAEFSLPPFPTTTIGSFPQTREVRTNRRAFKRGEITREQYEEFNREQIATCVRLQEEIGLDVLVHGEFERNDMVEYFGEQLSGFLFTEKAWVQSYGTRCVKPPIVWGDVSRPHAMTVAWSTYAQSLTKKPMKGMLTGPVTILNWSFPREDITREESTKQIALAIRDEVLDLEAAGIKVIQVDEAALREKLPLRKSDWFSEYLDWAIPAFRLVHSGLKPTTQLHTHMCYSEFTDIIRAIDAMDADVITFEASRSDLLILDSLAENHFETEVGPGVYDIHSPRVPSEQEIVDALHKMVRKVSVDKLWVNPDCGLKTRGEAEVRPSLEHMVAAARELRGELEAGTLDTTPEACACGIADGGTGAGAHDHGDDGEACPCCSANGTH